MQLYGEVGKIVIIYNIYTVYNFIQRDGACVDLALSLHSDKTTKY